MTWDHDTFDDGTVMIRYKNDHIAIGDGDDSLVALVWDPYIITLRRPETSCGGLRLSQDRRLSLACLDTACKNGLQLRSDPSLDTPFPHNTFSTLRAKLYCNQDGDLEEMLLLLYIESLYYNRNIRGNWLRL